MLLPKTKSPLPPKSPFLDQECALECEQLVFSAVQRQCEAAPGGQLLEPHSVQSGLHLQGGPNHVSHCPLPMPTSAHRTMVLPITLPMDLVSLQL